jgi:hypothetical protein
MRPLPIHLLFNRAQERGVPGLAFGQQLTHVRPVVPGPVGPSLNVSAHKTSPAMTLPSAGSTPVRVASRDDRMRSRFPAWWQAPESGYLLAGMPGSGHPYQPAGTVAHNRGRLPAEERSTTGAGGAARRGGAAFQFSVDTAK